MLMSEKSKHVPVMLQEVLQLVREMSFAPKLGLDLTFGRGGHTGALIEEFPGLKMWALDQDSAAIRFGQEKFAHECESGRLRFFHHSFHDFSATEFEKQKFDFILADLGVSSPQLDEAERGFSFYADGPLDMRMDQRRELTAADIINQWQPAEIEEVFREYGEIRQPRRVVERILERRRIEPFSRTLELAQLIEKAMGWRKRGHHPATEFFLALRLAVNDEITALRPAVEGWMTKLALRGRMIVLTFHSLEDRIIKYTFKERVEWGAPVNKKVIVPSRPEVLANVRARSAKLRAFERATEES